MAKLWEVLKAFDEGKSIKADRLIKDGRRIDLYWNGKKEGVSLHFNGHRTELKTSDFNATDWEIQELPERKTFRFLQVVCELSGDKRPTRLLPEFFDYENVVNAKRLIESDYKNDEVKILSAVGVDEKGISTVLVQRGEIL